MVLGNKLLEWSSPNASAADSRRDAVQTGGQGIGAVVCFIYAVTTHAIRTAIEHGRVCRIKSALAPVPVLKYISIKIDQIFTQLILTG